MWLSKLGFSALTFELAAWGGAFASSNCDVALAAFLGGHAVASALISPVFLAFLPKHLQQPRLPALLLGFSISYCLPLIGAIGQGLCVLALRRHRRGSANEPFRAVHLPDIDPHQRPGKGFRQAGLGSFLANTRAPEATRLRALVALQNVPGRVASSLLRNVLSDPSEDIRLLAYGMLDNQEKRLNDLIHSERQRLAAGGNERTAAVRRLSELYWELVYHDLVQGDLRAFALNQSQEYTQEALTAAHEDTGLHLRLGRLKQMLGDAAGARAAYGQALLLGMPQSRITPYLAELDFDERDFDSVRAHMAELGQWRSLPRLRPIIQFWSRA